MKLIAVAIFLFLTSICKGQINIINQCLTDSTLNILYIGVENYLKITNAGKDAAKAKVTIAGAGATISKESKDIYRVTLSTTGLCEVQLIIGTKSIFKKDFVAATINYAIATLSGLKDTTVKKNRILINPFLSAIIPGCYYRQNIFILSFQATFIQGADSTLTTVNGYQFSNEQIRLTKLLNSDDKIYFNDIRATSPDSRTFALPAFWIKIE